MNDIQETEQNLSSARSMSYDGSQQAQSTNQNNDSKQIYRVLYDFVAKTDDELDVRAGDCVLVESRIGEDWLIGQV